MGSNKNEVIAGLDIERLRPLAIDQFNDVSIESLQKIALMIRVAHCARISYNNFEGKDDYNADIKLYHRLLASGHLSPFEHCAQAMDEFERYEDPRSGNFLGFIQLRKTIEGENKSDSRIIIK